MTDKVSSRISVIVEPLVLIQNILPRFNKIKTTWTSKFLSRKES